MSNLRGAEEFERRADDALERAAYTTVFNEIQCLLLESIACSLRAASLRNLAPVVGLEKEGNS